MATFSEDEYPDTTDRQGEVMRLRARFHDRIPVVCTPLVKENELTKSKFLVPCSMMYGEFKYILQKHLYTHHLASSSRVGKNSTLFLYVNNHIPKISTPMEDLYRSYCSSDGILYMNYSYENALG